MILNKYPIRKIGLNLGCKSIEDWDFPWIRLTYAKILLIWQKIDEIFWAWIIRLVCQYCPLRYLTTTERVPTLKQ